MGNLVSKKGAETENFLDLGRNESCELGGCKERRFGS